MTVEEQIDTLAKATAEAEEARLHYVHDGRMKEGGDSMKTEDDKRSSGLEMAALGKVFKIGKEDVEELLNAREN